MSNPTDTDFRPEVETEIKRDAPCQPGDIVYDIEGNQYRVIEDLGSGQFGGWRRIRGRVVRYANP